MGSSRKSEGSLAASAVEVARSAALGLAAWLAALLACHPASALGEPFDPDPSALNQKAIELSREGALTEAIDVWWTILDSEGEGYKYAAVVHRNIGRNFQKLELWAEAWYHLDRCVRLDASDVKCAQWRMDVEEKLLPGHVRVLLQADAAECRLVLEEAGAERSLPSPVEWWFVRGAHKVLVSDPIAGTRSEIIEVAENAPPRVLTCRQEAFVPAVEPAVRSSWLGRVEFRDWLLVGGGVAALLAGGATWWVASSRLDDLDADFETRYGDAALTMAQYLEVEREWESGVDDRVEPWERASYVLWGVGGAALATGAVLAAVLTPEDGEALSVTVVPAGPAGEPPSFLLEFPF